MPHDNAAGKRLDSIEQYRSRTEELKSNRVVKRPIGRIDRSAIGKGRKKKYTPTRMRNEINKYFEHCENEDLVPSIKGMMIFMKMYKDTFYTYLRYPEFTDLLEHARLIIAEWTESDVYNTTGQAAGKIAYMKNIHGWSDKLETKNETEVRQVTSVEEARQRIEALAPQLLDFLNNQMTVNQIAEDAEFVEEKKDENIQPEKG